MRTLKTSFTTLFLSAFLMPAMAGETFKIDGAHSSLLFAVNHNNVAMSYGRFNEFSGSVTYDEGNVSQSSFNLEIKAESIDSNHSKRDQHLRSGDFFNAIQFPKITFKSTKVEKAADGKLNVVGDLTLLGKTQTVTFEIQVSGPVAGRNNSKVRGFQGHGVIKRSEFGMTYQVGPIGDDVKIIVSLEAVNKG